MKPSTGGEVKKFSASCTLGPAFRLSSFSSLRSLVTSSLATSEALSIPSWSFFSVCLLESDMVHKVRERKKRDEMQTLWDYYFYF
ncbi:hypothetical protein K450DRAFT_258613 [Umbelopsis ramanniana AG]|uniref:Uncharacterized protein n=1 Tax=Umbelopsis ramanniana AG TaxID=1314678 RepID=A0AAD5E3K2_UMBRA|nr:uncharacterized protein K450DRAFT_258613 [Umbelopsis ramanniana AG]KAI8576042.1 hypothetical protein K450DRAFT_258613 [Umbelopsis ramanniana AG]